MNGLSGILGAPDELCTFEKRPREPFEDCGDGTGSGGVTGSGCYSRRDFFRGAVLAGLAEEMRLGANPFRLGVVGGTDTHNGTPGAVEEADFVGHRGTTDDSPEKRLGEGTRRNGPTFSPGGLTAVWAEENTRASLFDTLRRREVYATSGPRLTVRFFSGAGLPAALCDDPALVEQADARADGRHAPRGGRAADDRGRGLARSGDGAASGGPSAARPDRQALGRRPG